MILTVAHRSFVAVFSSTAIVIEPLPASPLTGETLHQAVSPSTVASHDTFAVNEIVIAPPPAETDREVFVPSANFILSSSIGCCSILIVCFAVPACITTLHERFAAVVFSLTVIVMALLLPAPPLDGETVHHPSAALTLAFHDVLAANDTDSAPPFPETTGAVSVPDDSIILSGCGSGSLGVVLSLLQVTAINAITSIYSNFFIVITFLVFLIHYFSQVNIYNHWRSSRSEVLLRIKNQWSSCL